MATEDIKKLEGLLAKPDPIRWVFAGDSITHGALHTMGWRDYVELFGERLRWELQRYRDGVIKTAVSGWRVPTLAEDFEWSALQYRPDVLSIALGMNDCTAGAEGLAAFRDGLGDLVRRARQRLPGVVVLLHTPPRILPTVDRHAHLPSYAGTTVEVAHETGAILVDHFAAWEAAERSGTINYWLSDPFHPNECGHRAMNRTLLQAIGKWDPNSITGRLLIP